MGIIGDDLRLFFISELRQHWDNLEREMYTKQKLGIMKGIRAIGIGASRNTT